jgi:hypothetical protein
MIYARNNRNRSQGAARVFANPFALNILFIALAASMLAGYLAFSTQTSADGMTVRSLEKRVNMLEAQKRRLEIETLSKQSMGSVAGAARDLGFVQVSDLKFLSPTGGAVAVR